MAKGSIGEPLGVVAQYNINTHEHHHRLVPENLQQHREEGYRVLYPVIATMEVVRRNIVFFGGEAMDIRV